MLRISKMPVLWYDQVSYLESRATCGHFSPLTTRWPGVRAVGQQQRSMACHLHQLVYWWAPLWNFCQIQLEALLALLVVSWISCFYCLLPSPIMYMKWCNDFVAYPRHLNWLTQYFITIVPTLNQEVSVFILLELISNIMFSSHGTVNSPNTTDFVIADHMTISSLRFVAAILMGNNACVSRSTNNFQSFAVASIHAVLWLFLLMWP